MASSAIDALRRMRWFDRLPGSIDHFRGAVRID